MLEDCNVNADEYCLILRSCETAIQVYVPVCHNWDLPGAYSPAIRFGTGLSGGVRVEISRGLVLGVMTKWLGEISKVLYIRG